MVQVDYEKKMKVIARIMNRCLVEVARLKKEKFKLIKKLQARK